LGTRGLEIFFNSTFRRHLRVIKLDIARGLSIPGHLHDPTKYVLGYANARQVDATESYSQILEV